MPRVRRVRGLINLQRLAKNMLTKQPALHPHMGPVEKKVKGNLPKKSKISWEPLPSTSQDYSSSSDLENFEEDEASSKTWTIVERKLLNHHVLEQSASCRFCECSGTKCVLSILRKRQCIKILKKWQALDSAQNGHEVPKKQPNDNSKVNRTQVKISTSAESNFAA